MNSFGSFPYTGSLKALHSWAPALEGQQDFLSLLIENMEVKSWDQTLPLACSGAMTSTGDIVEYARYRTLEPLAPLCFIDISISNMTLGGVASGGIFIELPIAPLAVSRTVLYGITNNVGALVGITADAVSTIESKLVRAHRTDNLNWALGATTSIRLTGWYDYGA